MTSLACLLELQAQLQSDGPAILARGRAGLSYSGLWEQVCSLAAALQARGLGPGSRVAVVLPNGPEMALAFLGVAASATCVPLNPASRDSEFRFYFEDMRVQAVLMRRGDDGPARAAALAMGLSILDLEVPDGAPAGRFNIGGPAAAPLAAPVFAGAGDVALVLHTSGTTARPKIVPLSQHNLVSSARNIARHLALTPDDRCLNVMPLFHIHGLVGVLLSSLAGGSSVVCTPGYGDADFFDWVRDFEPSWYSAVPTIHQAVLAQGRHYREKAPHHRFRFVRSSSASLPPATMTELEALVGAPVIEAYGMTEAAHQMTSNALPPGERLAGSVGVAAGVEVALLDEAGRRVEAVGQPGEIVIRGPSVITAYENNPVANAASFVEGWFRTGDQGTFDAAGRLFISGRIKEIVNRGGEKVSPREVDDALLEHPAVAQVVAFPVPHATLGEDLAAAVVRRAGQETGEAELRQFLYGRLSEFKVPSRILFVDSIPKGPTGKVQRLSLHKAFESALVTDYVAPSNDLELGLAAAWQKVLGVPRVGLTDNFFALGGDSLGAFRLVHEMELATGLTFELVDIFRSPTIGQLVAGHAPDAPRTASVVVPLQSEGDGVPVFCLYGINLYKAFADSLGKDQPVYGVFVHEEQAIVNEVMQGGIPDFSVQSLVAAYAHAIERFRPQGPYRLAGFSFGGILAIELAARLRARGDQVEIVMLLDTVLAQGQSRNWLRWLGYRLERLLNGQSLSRLLRRLGPRAAAMSGSLVARLIEEPASPSEALLKRQTEAFRRVARAWRPNLGLVDFPVVLFRAMDRSRWAPYVDLKEDYGWRQVVGERLQIVDVPGVHLKIVEPPNVAELGNKARALMRSLAGAPEGLAAVNGH